MDVDKCNYGKTFDKSKKFCSLIKKMVVRNLITLLQQEYDNGSI